MFAALEKWQAAIVVLAIVVAVTVLAALGQIAGDTVATGLLSLATLVLGAGAQAHGVKQGSQASTAPPPET